MQHQRQNRANKRQAQEAIVKPKLPTAEQTYHRFLHDPHLQTERVTIGYVDRFTGIIERPLEEWSLELTSETYIPFHRVRYFKYDGLIVWNRDDRTYLIDQLAQVF